MVVAARVPGKGWYVLAGVIALATVTGIGGAAAWLYLEFNSAEPFLAPGRHSVELKKPGNYLVWNDHLTVFQGRTYDEPLQLPKGVQISVIDKAGGQRLPVGSFSGATSDSGTTKSIAVAQFTILQPGRYEVIVEGEFAPRVFSVGRNLVFHMAGVIFGAIALMFAGFSAALLIAGWVYLSRDEVARAASAARASPVNQAGTGQGMDAGEPSLRRLTAIVYGLQLASFLVGITFIGAVIINYLKRRDVEGTWLESHFRWQIRTFWYGLLWSAIGVVLAFVLIGFLVLMAAAAWLLYRAIKGWIALEDGKPMYA